MRELFPIVTNLSAVRIVGAAPVKVGEMFSELNEAEYPQATAFMLVILIIIFAKDASYKKQIKFIYSSLCYNKSKE